MKNTLEKIRRNTRNLGLAGLIGAGSVFMNGCETPQDRMITGMLLGGLAPYSATPQAAQSANFIGGAMVSSANAELSRSQVNVNVNQGLGGQGNQERLPVATMIKGIRDCGEYGSENVRIILCNYCQDFDKNGFLEMTECIGMKENFSTNEQVVIRIDSIREDPNKFLLEYKLFGPNGSIIKHLLFDKDNNHTEGIEDLYKAGELKTGNYTVAVYRKDKHIGMFLFEVMDR